MTPEERGKALAEAAFSKGYLEKHPEIIASTIAMAMTAWETKVSAWGSRTLRSSPLSIDSTAGTSRLPSKTRLVENNPRIDRTGSATEHRTFKSRVGYHLML